MCSLRLLDKNEKKKKIWQSKSTKNKSVADKIFYSGKKIKFNFSLTWKYNTFDKYCTVHIIAWWIIFKIKQFSKLKSMMSLKSLNDSHFKTNWFESKTPSSGCNISQKFIKTFFFFFKSRNNERFIIQIL